MEREALGPSPLRDRPPLLPKQIMSWQTYSSSVVDGACIKAPQQLSTILSYSLKTVVKTQPLLPIHVSSFSGEFQVQQSVAPSLLVHSSIPTDILELLKAVRRCLTPFHLPSSPDLFSEEFYFIFPRISIWALLFSLIGLLPLSSQNYFSFTVDISQSHFPFIRYYYSHSIYIKLY